MAATESKFTTSLVGIAGPARPRLERCCDSTTAGGSAVLAAVRDFVGAAFAGVFRLFAGTSSSESSSCRVHLILSLATK